MPARLLIVDDEPSICFALARFFKDRGDVVFTSASAEDALAKLSQTQPDAIFLDIRLPGISGLEAMEELQSSGFRVQGSGDATVASQSPSQSAISNPQSAMPDLPPAIIVMTAHGTMDAAIDAMRQGAYDYLV